MNYGTLHPAEQLTEIMKRIYARRLTTTSGGNLSVKDENGNVWITPGGTDKGSLIKEDMVCLQSGGTISGRHKPSSEYPFHLKIYETRKDVRAILHAHSPALVAFSIVRKIPDTAILPSIYLECGKVGLAKYAMTGSHELGERIAEVFRQGCDAAIMENHGVVIGAENLLEAFGKFEALETAARIQIHAAAIGKTNRLDKKLLEAYRGQKAFSAADLDFGKTSREEQEARREICSFAARAYRQGLITCMQGSFSQRIAQEKFVITPQKQDRFHLKPTDLVLVENNRAERGKEPDQIAAVHQEIYRAHPEINSILYCQPPYTMAFAVTNEPLDSRIIPESYVMMREIPRFAGTADPTDPQKLAELFDKSTPIVLMENHGLLVTGQSMLEAFDRLEVTENSARSMVIARNLGEMIPIDEKGLEEIRAGFHLK